MIFGALGILFLVAPNLASTIPASETPKRGGVLRLAQGPDPQTLDPVLMMEMEDVMIYPLLFLPLLDVTNSTNLVPCAAVSWNISPDCRTYTFRLRPGLKFSNGREVLAGDYVFTIERLLNPGTASFLAVYFTDVLGADAFVSGQTNRLTGVKAIDSHTLVVELVHPDPTFPYLMSTTAATATPREEVVGRERDFALCPVGNGPYMVQEWVRGARLLLTRNPYYSGPEPAHFDAVEVFVGGDDTTRLMMFERGETDVGPLMLPRPTIRRLVKDRHWRDLVERKSLFSVYFVALNTEMAPLNNVLVRRAMNCAIDRDRRMGVDFGFYEHAEGVLPPGMPGYNSQLRGYRHNPERARELLRESGLSLPIRSELWHYPSDESRLISQGIQWDLGQVGIDIELKAVTPSELTVASQVRGKVPMSLTYWTSAILDPKDLLGLQFDGRSVTNAATMNISFYSNPQVTQLLEDAALEIDKLRRFKLYQRAEELIVRDAPWVFLGHMNLFGLRQQWLKGPLLEPLWWLRFDRVWIER